MSYAETSAQTLSPEDTMALDRDIKRLEKLVDLSPFQDVWWQQQVESEVSSPYSPRVKQTVRREVTVYFDELTKKRLIAYSRFSIWHELRSIGYQGRADELLHRTPR